MAKTATGTRALVEMFDRWYEESRLSERFAEYEPEWRPLGFDDRNTKTTIAKRIGTLDLAYSDPIFGARPLQDGLKIATSTWVFMGRRTAEKEGLFLVCPTDPTLVANGRRVPQGVRSLGYDGPEVLWAIWRLDDDGFLLQDRVPGRRQEVEQIFASPLTFGAGRAA